MPAFYHRSLSGFLSDDLDAIVGSLTGASASAGFFQQVHAQTVAWQTTVTLLGQSLGTLARQGVADGWHLLLEYPIPRRGKRIDAVLLAGTVVVVLEFKIGARDHARDAIAQVEDYALDLHDFHQQSRDRPIVPMLVATDASPRPWPTGTGPERVKPTWLASAATLAEALRHAVECSADAAAAPIDAARWEASDYAPTPTIIEAAQALYAGQNVREISRSHAGIVNLTRTTEAVIQAIESARAGGHKQICFVTGVPGAGKTLAGLNLVHNPELHERDLGVFLSGNAPLVRVLREALARDAAARLDQSRAASRRRVETFIQNVHHFIDAYFQDPDRVPVDQVVVFDEAQRAWDAEQSRRKFNRPFSEPEILLDVMDRHPGWAVVVALVGGGQEINRGEAGLAEWGRALSQRFRHWRIAVAPALTVGRPGVGSCLFPEPPEGLSLRAEPALHLSVNLRSYRAEVLAEFVDALLRLDVEQARALMARLDDFPLVLTRDLEQARRWLRTRRRGHRRIGLVASSGGRRLRAHGIDVTTELDVENWFLNGPHDVRASHALELPATEFAIQGLELDWTAVGWDADLIPLPDAAGWLGRSFRGTRWQHVHDDVTRQYLINKYRVLLTRAREGMVLWVPPGDPDDATRCPRIYDQIAAYLHRCGVPVLEPMDRLDELPGQDSNLEKQDQNLL